MPKTITIDGTKYTLTPVAPNPRNPKVTFDFGDGNGPVPAHKHSNGGGWVADSAKVDPSAYVGPDAPKNSPASKGVIELLYDAFGGTRNEKGYIELDPHIGCIYGDAITFERANNICTNLANKGFASTNMVYGVGSYTYQYTTRDVFGFAMKATWAQINGESNNLFKKPVTDTGLKNSATGRLSVVRNGDGTLICIEKASPEQEKESLLVTVFENGSLLVDDSLETIRQRLVNPSNSPQVTN